MREHPFVEVDDWRQGYRQYHFEYGGESFRLLTVERADEAPHSILAPQDALSGIRHWFGMQSFPCVLNVDAAVKIIGLMKTQRASGEMEGIAKIRQEMVSLLGIS